MDEVRKRRDADDGPAQQLRRRQLAHQGTCRDARQSRRAPQPAARAGRVRHQVSRGRHRRRFRGSSGRQPGALPKFAAELAAGFHAAASN